MVFYLSRRLGYTLLMLLGMTVASFLIMRLVPGDFLAELRLNPEISQSTLEALEKQYGLDKPLYVQYFHWLARAVRFDFGDSFTWQAPVRQLVGWRAGNTLILSVTALVVAWGLAVPIGIHAAVRQYSWSDKLFTTVSFMGLSLPGWFLALLVMFGIVRLGLGVPLGGATSVDYAWMGTWEKVVDRASHLALPALVLGVHATAGLMRYMRGSLLDVLRQDYITTARAKGAGRLAVIYKHALRNAVNPLITIFGFQLGDLLSGAALTEIVLGWPGLGQLMLHAVLARDYNLVMGGLVMSGVMLVVGNLIADVMLALSDPRIRYQ